jgi:hypothetical protein
VRTVAKKQTTAEQLPATLSPNAFKRYGNIEARHMELPALKLLQHPSPEVKQRHELRAGSFYHAILEEDLGEELQVVVLFVHVGGVIRSPRLTDGSGGLILARSPDDINWETPFAKVPVTLPGGFKSEYDLRANVSASGLDKWGTSDPRDPKSPPAYTKQYTVLMRIVGIEGPVVYVPSRTGNIEVERLNTKVEVRAANGVPPRRQLFKLNCYERSSSPTISWFVPRWTAAGPLEDEKLAAACEAEAERLSSLFQHIVVVGGEEMDDHIPQAGATNVAY